MKTNKRLLELDSLRGIAALAVVLYHYTVRYGELFHPPQQSLFHFKYGEYGVHLFFMISGFVIYMSIAKQVSVKEFVLKRAIRLYPAYIFAVLITFITVRWYGLEGRIVSLTDAIINVTMFQGYIPGVDNVDGVYWTLNIELTFYILVGFVMVLGLVKKIELMATLWLIWTAILMGLSMIIDSGWMSVLKVLSLTSYSHLFVAGIMFYKLRNEGKLLYHIMIFVCLIFQYLQSDIVLSVFVTIFFTLFYALIYEKLVFMRTRLFVFLGTISYSLYLIHQNIGYIIMDYLNRLEVVPVLVLLIPVTVSIVLATIITIYIEKPIQAWIKNLVREQSKKPENAQKVA